MGNQRNITMAAYGKSVGGIYLEDRISEKCSKFPTIVIKNKQPCFNLEKIVYHDLHIRECLEGGGN